MNLWKISIQEQKEIFPGKRKSRHDSHLSFDSEEIKDRWMSGKKRVLVVDDEVSVLEVVREMLRYLGFEVTTAEGGKEAIHHFKKHHESNLNFDFVITDLTLPGDLDGIEILKQLKGIDPGVKVIISSGYFNDPIMADYKRHGFLGVMVKPYTVHDLEKKLNQLKICSK
ncbi:MAG: response regulator [Nitrospirae bacterium]|nr:response regulator [Nitrospirota bacterium]MBI3594743.1 response regulator [Nitrospirota bacterium]